MEGLFDGAYRGATVLVTGHTGFKGSWLASWLDLLGAKVVGYALPPPDDRPSHFEATRIESRTDSVFADIRDLDRLVEVFEAFKPEFVFHLAAQSLVRPSYAEPVGTTTTNVVGTVHVLEAIRRVSSVRAAVIVTTDKCYENDESGRPYRESDRLGGYDPYSASKAAAEIMTACYRQSFFNPDRAGSSVAGIATARAGNVIGGGDWATDRLIPDAVTALSEGRDFVVRNPRSVRPWQHVLEPLSGYLWLGARLAAEPGRFASAWNFGPDPGGDLSVRDVADAAVAAWGSGRWVDGSAGQDAALHEAASLRLDCTRAHEELSWRPVWNVPEAVRTTIEWYRAFYQSRPFDAASFTESQIESYTRRAHEGGLAWAAAVEHQDAGEAR